MDFLTSSVTSTSVAYWANWLILLFIAWTLPWKGIALWRAAGNKHLWWFVALFLVNTLAILEIIYIFGFSRKEKPQSETV